MSIFRKDEHPVVSIAFEVAAYIVVGLFCLTVYGLVQMWVQL